jgi:hypothetical protein
MSEGQHFTGIVNGITQFAMHQTSRRGFFKWVGKAGLALAAAMGGGLAFVSPAFAWIDCRKYLPGCYGPCTCDSSGCQDPDDGWVDRCFGACGDPGHSSICVQLFVYYTWNPQLNQCVQVSNCGLCSCP